MAHIHEKIDYAADVFIVYKNKVLLRMHDKYNKWLPPGGHVELDEDPNQAAVREVKEEVGLDVKLWDGNVGALKSDTHVKILIPPVSMNRHATSGTHEHVSLVYFAKSDTDKIKPENGEECRWVTKKELETMELGENIRQYAKLALDTLGK